MREGDSRVESPKKSKFVAMLTAVIDVISVGLLWLVCSLPILTLGAASETGDDWFNE